MIEARDIVKSFDGKQVLRGISARFEPGKTNLVIGKSGSGKTVLLKILSGLLRPDAGAILFEGRNALQMSTNTRRKMQQQVGMLFQNGALFDALTVLENVAFPLRHFSNMTPQQIQRRALECLDRVELRDAAKLRTSDLSGGMCKRVAIARAIALKPRYLFCDEPNSGLDPQTSVVIDALIHEITEEGHITTIVNTHDMNSVLAIGDWIFFLHNGLLAWQGTNVEVLETDNEELNDFVFATPMARRVKAAQ